VNCGTDAGGVKGPWTAGREGHCKTHIWGSLRSRVLAWKMVEWLQKPSGDTCFRVPYVALECKEWDGGWGR